MKATWTPGLQLLTGLAIGIGLLCGTQVLRTRANHRASLNGRADLIDGGEIRRAIAGWPR